MDDFNYLHKTYEQSKEMHDDLEAFGLRPEIYVVEDDNTLGLSIKKYLSRTINCDVFYHDNSQSCLNAILDRKSDKIPFCLITDISLENGQNGLLLIDSLREKNLKFVSIAMTGFATIENAISATKKGVYHYLTKPFELDNLKKLVIEALSQQLGLSISSTEQEQNESKQNFRLERPTADDMFCTMIGRSKAMLSLFDRIKKVALTDSTVLISGASGTGKELVACAIKNLSKRVNAPMVSVNCGAIPADLLESELFGHVKGAFTGAISNRKGRFELADNGTIFLDEIGDMPQHLQVKILRVLQNKTYEPVGSHETRKVNARIIAATHRNLEKMVQEGKFREDLYYRLNVIPLKVPALKERREDIALLFSYFVDKFVSADKSNNITFSDQALDMLISYDWPGNVRELENLVERLVILKGGSKIQPEDLPAKIMTVNPLSTDSYKYVFELPEVGIDLKKILSDIEDSLILQALSYTSGNKNQASKLLCLNRTTLIEKMKKKEIEF